MNNQQAKAVFNQIASTHRANGNLDQAARTELAGEFFTNPVFRKALENHLWEKDQSV